MPRSLTWQTHTHMHNTHITDMVTQESACPCSRDYNSAARKTPQAFFQVAHCQSTNPAPNNNLAVADTAQAHKRTGNVFPHVTHRSNALETVELSPHKAVKPPNGIPFFQTAPAFHRCNAAETVEVSPRNAFKSPNAITAATRSRQWSFHHTLPHSISPTPEHATGRRKQLR